MLFLVTSLFAASVDVYEGDDLATLTSSLNPGDEIRLHKGTYPVSEMVSGGPAWALSRNRLPFAEWKRESFCR